MARTVPCTFKDFILVATAVVVVKPRHALMASQRQDTPATPRDRPYGVQRVPLQASRCPSCTSDLASALVRVEPAHAEAGPLERERPRRVSLQQPMCTGERRMYTGAMRSSV
jgi:hypothetical protein